MFLIGNLRLSGANRVAWEIASRLPKFRYNILIASLQNLNSKTTFKTQEAASQKGIKIIVLDIIKRGRIRTVLDLITILRKYKIHIIHSHGESCDTHGRIAAILASTPIRIVTIHNMYPHIGKEYIGFFIDRILAPFTSKFLAVAHSVEKYTRDRLSMSNNKITTIYNGVDLKLFHNISRATYIKQKHGLALDKKTIGCIGLICKLKGQHMLLEATRILEKNRHDFQIVFYGEGPDKQQIEEEIKKTKISCMKIYGWCNNRTEIYSAIDILVIPSFVEGLPLVMLEAFASSVPVIATNIGAISEFIIHNETGLLVPPGNPVAIANAISELIDNKQLCSKIRERAKNKVSSVEYMVSSYQKIYIELYAKLAK